jgi:hypothetical protein
MSLGVAQYSCSPALIVPDQPQFLPLALGKPPGKNAYQSHARQESLTADAKRLALQSAFEHLAMQN